MGSLKDLVSWNSQWVWTFVYRDFCTKHLYPSGLKDVKTIVFQPPTALVALSSNDLLFLRILWIDQTILLHMMSARVTHAVIFYGGIAGPFFPRVLLYPLQESLGFLTEWQLDS